MSLSEKFHSIANLPMTDHITGSSLQRGAPAPLLFLPPPARLSLLCLMTRLEGDQGGGFVHSQHLIILA